MGEGGAEINLDGNSVDVILKVCPFKKAGIDISNRYYCTYTEGLIETATKTALKNVEFQTLKLRAVDNCDCQFKLEIWDTINPLFLPNKVYFLVLK